MRVYVVRELEKEKYYPCGSLMAVSNVTGIPYSTLIYNFGKKKDMEYTRKGYFVVKEELIKSKRNG